MGISFGSRTLLAICVALVVLLAALAVVQYRWSTRVAAADVQRAKEHIESAASLFARDFNSMAAQATRFLHEDAHNALRSGEQLTGVPTLIGELYHLDLSPNGVRQVRRLTADGVFAQAPLPAWITISRCAPTFIEEPPSLVVPDYDVNSTESEAPGNVRVLKTFRWRSDACFVARLNQDWLRETMFPELIRRSFGDTAVGEYDFAVVSLNQRDRAIYGASVRSDLRKPFFPMGVNIPLLPQASFPQMPRPGVSVMMQRSDVVIQRGPADLLGGVWELQVAHKGLPLVEAFERARQWDLLMSLGVELLLVAAIGFLVIGSRRMQRLADQKMRFVAGVSHELRTPVSAIAMLSRNQADGMVTGAEKVKQYGELIHQQSRRLNDMVEQSLQYAGIHSGLRKTPKDDVDLRGLILEAVEARREELSRSGFEVETVVSPELPRVSGDARLLRTAFDNLLDNALKYAGGGRWIRVSAALAESRKEVLVSVEDRGTGIDPADQAEVFEPFCRGRAAVEAQIPGSGLGLSLVRSAAEAHRGTVTLVSEPGRGSTFTMHLPV